MCHASDVLLGPETGPVPPSPLPPTHTQSPASVQGRLPGMEAGFQLSRPLGSTPSFPASPGIWAAGPCVAPVGLTGCFLFPPTSVARPHTPSVSCAGCTRGEAREEGRRAGGSRRGYVRGRSPLSPAGPPLFQPGSHRKPHQPVPRSQRGEQTKGREKSKEAQIHPRFNKQVVK